MEMMNKRAVKVRNEKWIFGIGWGTRTRDEWTENVCQRQKMKIIEMKRRRISRELWHFRGLLQTVDSLQMRHFVAFFSFRKKISTWTYPCFYLMMDFYYASKSFHSIHIYFRELWKSKSRVFCKPRFSFIISVLSWVQSFSLPFYRCLFTYSVS